MNASPDVPTTNGASKGVNDVRFTDADSDVHMERSPASNVHEDNTPPIIASCYGFYAIACYVQLRFFTPALDSMEDDDEARPPPAQRARKFSDTDQASITCHYAPRQAC
jgi:hypothetical protein